jgi:hypothetical protein
MAYEKEKQKKVEEENKEKIKRNKKNYEAEE